jgi:hypothetical protein
MVWRRRGEREWKNRLGARWGSEVSCKPQPFIPVETSPVTNWVWDWVWPVMSESFGENIKTCPYLQSNHDFSASSALSSHSCDIRTYTRLIWISVSIFAFRDFNYVSNRGSRAVRGTVVNITDSGKINIYKELKLRICCHVEFLLLMNLKRI